jgi:hypothetical protein
MFVSSRTLALVRARETRRDAGRERLWVSNAMLALISILFFSLLEGRFRHFLSHVSS